ncbi:hypothetical protein BBJ28_00010258 [Nothophytophthora sp. Chile5]|nr:hypothetical protein BBJ28_00010258 [Nothophytophthora sp. Chile5]
MIRALMAAGADMAACDKKGVRPMDLITWTGAAHPAIMVPLQDDVLHLQQRNALQLERNTALAVATTSLQGAVLERRAQTQELQQDLAVARAFRADLTAQIHRAQAADRELAAQIQAEEPQLRWIRDEVARLRCQNGSADLEVARVDDAARQLVATRDALQVTHARQQQGRAQIAAQCAVKCEAVGLLRRFPTNEALQTRTLRALLVMCSKPAVRRQLLINGLQSLLLDVLAQFPRNEDIRLAACELVVLLTKAASRPSDQEKTLKPWPTRELLTRLQLTPMGGAEPLVDTTEVGRVSLEVLKCLKAAPQLTDIDSDGRFILLR